MPNARKPDRFGHYETSVFVNCPFDPGYQPLFQALVFATFACGFRARCALEAADSGDVRIEKILRIIEECQFSIHDLSRTELDATHNLPRFNMPLELGMCLGAKRLGDRRQKRKIVLILDVERYRYQKFISDIAGHDISAHGGDPLRAIAEVRNWFSRVRRRLPGAGALGREYRRFTEELPAWCGRVDQDVEELTFNDLAAIILEWLAASGNR